MNVNIQNKWESRAIVRSRPRLTFDKNDTGYFYPISKQPLCYHPLVEVLGEDAKIYILAQSLYKYSNDIAAIETRVVNDTVLDLLNNNQSVKFDAAKKIGAYTVMVDEAYHAYVAYDAMLQISEYTGIDSLSLPNKIEIEFAIEAVKNELDSQLHKDFELIAVCIAENTLTKEIVMMLDQNETHPFFQKMIKEHLADESRHSGYFLEVLEYFWTNLNSQSRESLKNVLVKFIELYLGLRVQKDFDQQILRHLGVSDKNISLIISDIYDGMVLNAQHPMLKNIIFLLTRAKVMDDSLKKQFENKGWM